jgi:hypothetical protein
MRWRSVLGVLLLGACSHSSSHSEAAAVEAIGRGIWCGATYDRATGECSNARPRPATVGVTLRGQVLTGGAMDEAPVPFVQVLLRRDGRELASTATDRTGHFSFKHPLPDGDYELALGPGNFTGSVAIFVDRGRPDVVLFATRQPVVAR